MVKLKVLTFLKCYLVVSTIKDTHTHSHSLPHTHTRDTDLLPCSLEELDITLFLFYPPKTIKYEPANLS